MNPQVKSRATNHTSSGAGKNLNSPKKRRTRDEVINNCRGMKRTHNGSTKSNTQKRRTREVNNNFEKAFASVPIVEQAKQNQGMGNICSLGAECKNIHIKGTMNCHGDGCDHRIHHLCEIMQNLLDKDNELNVYCSTKCVPKQVKMKIIKI